MHEHQDQVLSLVKWSKSVDTYPLLSWHINHERHLNTTDFICEFSTRNLMSLNAASVPKAVDPVR